MDVQSSKNLWGKKAPSNGQGGGKWRTSETNTTASSLTAGPFGSSSGSAPFSGPSSMPAMQKEKSKMFSFELGSTSSDSSQSCSTGGSGSTSMLAFGMVANKYKHGSTFGSEEKKMEWASSGGSSRNSSNKGSWSQLEWGARVENVFKEEIGKMTESRQRQIVYRRI